MASDRAFPKNRKAFEKWRSRFQKKELTRNQDGADINLLVRDANRKVFFAEAHKELESKDQCLSSFDQGSQASVTLYKILDERWIASEEENFLWYLEVLLNQNKGKNNINIKTTWIVGEFLNKSLRTKVAEALVRHNANWIEGPREDCHTQFVENGLFVPSVHLLSLIDAHSGSEIRWITICPWFCVLTKAAEKDLFTDLERGNTGLRYEMLLRKSVNFAWSKCEAEFESANKTSGVLSKNMVAEKGISSYFDGASMRAGWALDVQDIASHEIQQVVENDIRRKKNSPEFHFGICLRSRACTHNWLLTCRNLERTLRNLARQRCQDFQIWIAVHERPNIEMFGLNIKFVVVDFEPPLRADGTFGNDKRRKRNAIGRALAQHARSGFYYMQLDADDLIDISLVGSVYNDDNRSGYLVESGYIFDYAHGVAAECNEKTVPFWKQCGSCAVLYFEPEELTREGDEESYFERQRFHESFLDLSEKKGKSMKRWADNMALYLVNHGENHWSSYRHEGHRGRASSKSNFAHRHQIKTSAAEHGLSLRYPELFEHEDQVAALDKETKV